MRSPDCLGGPSSPFPDEPFCFFNGNTLAGLRRPARDLPDARTGRPCHDEAQLRRSTTRDREPVPNWSYLAAKA